MYGNGAAITSLQLLFVHDSSNYKLNKHQLDPSKSLQVCEADVHQQTKIPENEITVNHAVMETNESNYGVVALNECNGNTVGWL